jgi:hypothetical protein
MTVGAILTLGLGAYSDVNHVVTDNQDRTDEIDARLQRYAKYRMWTEAWFDWPWEDATDSRSRT